MNTIRDKGIMINLLVKEYLQYIISNPRLIYRIPHRLWEEVTLHLNYIIAKITGSDKNARLIRDLRKLKGDMEQADEVYKPSLLWKDLYDQFERVLHVEDIKSFKIQRYNRRFSAFAPTDPVIYKMFLWLYWNDIKRRDKYNLLKKLEEPTLGKADIYKINRTKMSHDLLQSIDEFYAIYPHVIHPNEQIIAAELGAGYGRLGYVFIKAVPKLTYIVIDLPGSLIIAQYYLTKLFPKEKILTFEKSRDLNKLDKKMLSKYKLVFLAPWQIPEIGDKSLDVFINIYSFQEMTKEQIRNYFSLIDKKCRGIFFNKQYYSSFNPKDGVKITNKDYPVKKTWEKIYENPSTIHQLTFEVLYKIPSK